MIFVLVIVLLLTFWRYAVNVRRFGIRIAILEIIAALASGLIAGIVFGLFARIAMRLLALALQSPLRLTATGTFTVIAVFSGLGIVLSLPYTGLLRDLLGRSPFLYAALLILITLQPFIRSASQDLGLLDWRDMRVIGGTALVSVIIWVPYSVLLEVSFSQLSRIICAGKFSQQKTIA